MQLGESVFIPDTGSVEEKPEPPKCKFCKKAVHPFAEKPGTNHGTGPKLDAQIHSGGADKKQHPWYTGGWSIQAHHLVCSEAMDDDDWTELCRLFGYDINRKLNGVMLPAKMPLACQLFAPLHRGPHEAGDADDLRYPKKVKQLIQSIKDAAQSGDYCGNVAGLVADLDAISKDLCAKIDAFAYTLTSDGADYAAGGLGCGDQTCVSDQKLNSCSLKRTHSLSHNGNVVPQRKGTLEVGK